MVHAAMNMSGHHDMSSHGDHDMSGHDMSVHANHDMSGQGGHDMSGHAGHDMSSPDAHVGHGMQMQEAAGGHAGGGHGGGHASPFVNMGGHGDGVLQAGVSEVLLFQGASTSSTGGLLVACFVLILLAIVLEYVRLLAWWLESRYVHCAGGRRDDVDAITTCNGKSTTNNNSELGCNVGVSRTSGDPLVNTHHSQYNALAGKGSSSTKGSNFCSKPSSSNFSILLWVGLGLLHIISYIWSTCLMLITMTFNIYLIVAIATGVSIGKLATMYSRTKLMPRKGQ